MVWLATIGDRRVDRQLMAASEEEAQYPPGHPRQPVGHLPFKPFPGRLVLQHFFLKNSRMPCCWLALSTAAMQGWSALGHAEGAAHLALAETEAAEAIAERDKPCI